MSNIKQIDHFSFKLTTTINLDKSELILYAPRNLHRPLAAKLENMIMSGMFSVQQTMKETVESKNNEKFNNEMSPEDIIKMLQVIPSQNYDFYPEFCDIFKALILSDGICKFIDNKKIEIAHYDEITLYDSDRLMGEYLKNFFIR